MYVCWKKLLMGRVLVPVTVLMAGILCARYITIPNAVAIDVVAPQHVEMYQIFYDIGNGFNEGDSVRARIMPSGEITTVTFATLPFKKMQHLRIDPGTRAGEIQIESITLLHRRFWMRIPLLQWKGDRLAEDFTPVAQLDDFRIKDHRLLLTSSGDDPYFLLRGGMDAVRAEVAAQGAPIRRYVYAASVFAALLLFFFYRMALNVARKTRRLWARCIARIEAMQTGTAHWLEGLGFLQGKSKVAVITRQSIALSGVFALAFVFVALVFLWQGNKGFNLWDEGFLWYGAQRVMLGEVPIRDFMSYDPGRYYWSAAIMHLLGDNGIMSLRFAVAIFQAFGLFVALLLIRESCKHQKISSFLYLVLSSVTLLLWMYPRHKLFDLSLSIFLIGILTFLIKKPDLIRYFLSGLLLGFIAVFGRNHGVYGMVGSLGVILWLHLFSFSFPVFIKRIFAFGGGVFVGYLPVLLMALFIPGFAAVFWDGIVFLLQRQTTNLTLPIPWPWIFLVSDLPFADKLRNMLIGYLFIATLAFGFLSLGWVLMQRFRKLSVPPVFVACAFMALPYAHFAFSRADVGHLAHGIFPLLIGLLFCFAKLKSKAKWSMAVGLCLVSAWVMYVYQPGWQKLVYKDIVRVDVSGSELHVPIWEANEITLLRDLVQEYAPGGQPIYVVPFWPGAYALFQMRSPTWSIYALWPRTEAFQKKEVERLMRTDPACVLILDIPLDNRDELRFKNTHPIVMDFIDVSFNPVAHQHGTQFLLYTSRATDCKENEGKSAVEGAPDIY